MLLYVNIISRLLHHIITHHKVKTLLKKFNLINLYLLHLVIVYFKTAILLINIANSLLLLRYKIFLINIPLTLI